MAAEYGTNCDTCAPILDLLGISSNDYEVSFVFVNAIASSFNEQYLDRVQDYAVSHELGHIIGRGLSDLCREPELHDPSSDTYCTMSFLSGRASGYGLPVPILKCTEPNQYDIIFSFLDGFCGKCNVQLSDLGFLLEDYVWLSYNPHFSQSETTRGGVQ